MYVIIIPESAVGIYTLLPDRSAEQHINRDILVNITCVYQYPLIYFDFISVFSQIFLISARIVQSVSTAFVGIRYPVYLWYPTHRYVFSFTTSPLLKEMPLKYALFVR